LDEKRRFAWKAPVFPTLGPNRRSRSPASCRTLNRR
jgi:hypothetical protein